MSSKYLFARKRHATKIMECSQLKNTTTYAKYLCRVIDVFIQSSLSAPIFGATTSAERRRYESIAAMFYSLPHTSGLPSCGRRHACAKVRSIDRGQRISIGVSKDRLHKTGCNNMPTTLVAKHHAMAH